MHLPTISGRGGEQRLGPMRPLRGHGRRGASRPHSFGSPHTSMPLTGMLRLPEGPLSKRRYPKSEEKYEKIVQLIKSIRK